MSRRIRKLAVDFARVTIFACFFVFIVLGDTRVAHATEITRLEPREGRVGDEVELFVRLNEPGDEFAVYWDTLEKEQKREKPSPGTTGHMTTFSVPKASKGRHYVIAKDLKTNTTHQLEFSVLPSVKLTPSSGVVGAEVSAEGRGWVEKETNISLTWNGQTIKSGLVADEDGSWETTFNVPETAWGDSKIHTFGSLTSRDEIREATFKVRPAISLTEAQGSVGSSVTARGTGFRKDETGIKLTFGGEPIIGILVSAKPNGTWTVDFQIPQVPAGSYWVNAEGSITKSLEICSVPKFTVKPSVNISPSKDICVPSDVQVEGNGFAGGKVVEFQLDGKLQSEHAPTNTSGWFRHSLDIKEAKCGSHTVIATDNNGNQAIGELTVECSPPEKAVLETPKDNCEVILPPDYVWEWLRFLLHRLGGRFGWWETVNKNSPLVLDWSDAQDNCNVVVYDVQIDPDPSFASPPSHQKVTDSKIELLDLPTKEGVLYWRVRATDGAGNVGNWSEYRSLKLVGEWWWDIILVLIVLGALGAILRTILGAIRKCRPPLGK
jgi:hypothetical protein